MALTGPLSCLPEEAINSIKLMILMVHAHDNGPREAGNPCTVAVLQGRGSHLRRRPQRADGRSPPSGLYPGASPAAQGRRILRLEGCAQATEAVSLGPRPNQSVRKGRARLLYRSLHEAHSVHEPS